MINQLIFILLVGVAFAAQTRIKIGSSSWGYQIEQGPNIRTEFADDNGVASGFYQFKVGNETKKLEYRIDPNSREPDISFNVTNVDTTEITTQLPPSSNTEKEEVSSTTVSTTEATSNSTTTESSPMMSTSSSSTEMMMNSRSVSSSNMTFDSIDSKQDFKGHVTLKVGNSTYTINFVTGDKAHTREETLLPSGMMFGRLSYLLRSSSPNKLVINYKFNSTSPDPTFEVSLYKTIESEPPSSSSGSGISGSSGGASGSGGHYQPTATPRDNYSRQVSYPARDRYTNAIHPSSVPGVRDGGSSSSNALPGVQRSHQHYSALAEKYRDRVQSQGVVPPNWYYNRGKPVIYDP